ncbi:hypothetical protein AALP_AA6G033600 [Arabis alpina]|uniref:GST C-terminal domain-containing protein n=1 Tax=Arabis alpina TaxID=50452 RepID=A0A087GLU8_ARAAL|nr:hypothetical protein AALP_AA6G033600 [Arabis alpina]
MFCFQLCVWVCCFEIFKLFTERPRVNEWLTEITKRPGSQKILQ